MIRWIIGESEESKNSIFWWNAVGGAISAGQSAILLVFISHKLGITIAGIVTIAYALANLFASITRYGVRNYQVTDSNNLFSFSDYLYGRIVCTVLSVLICIIYFTWCFAANGDTLSKIIILGEITILKLIDAVEDVYLGRYQQTGHFLVGARIMALRLVVSTVLMCVLVCAGVNIYNVLLAGIGISLLLDCVLIRSTFQITHSQGGTFDLQHILLLLKKCLPLCIGTTLSIYIGNVPKYMIDMYMNEAVQAIFGYIMMPVFVVMLLNTFIYQPMIKELGDIWNKKQDSLFRKRVFRQCLIVGCMTVVVIIGGMAVGLPVLSAIYNVDLSPYRLEFFLLLSGGGFYALAYYLNVPITTIRKQGYIAFGYVIAALCSLLAGRYFIVHYGMLGAAMLYLGINILLAVFNAIVLLFGMKRRQ